MTPAEYLASLPEPIQAELVAIAREAAGMTADEKGFAAAMFATVGAHFALRPLTDENERFIPGAQMVTALGLILRLANDEATQEKGA